MLLYFRVMSWFGSIILLFLLDSINSRTFQKWFSVNVYYKSTVGHLFEVQERSFEFDANGLINITVECDQPTDSDWGNESAFNVFLCNESPKTRWMYLYPDWGMCFDNYHPYHHCSVYGITRTNHTTWTFSHHVTTRQHLVARIRSCPIYHSTHKRSFPASFLFRRYQCQYTGIFLNNSTRLSLDEQWNPLAYGILSCIYGALVLKSLGEIIRYWRYRVNCSFYIYALVFTKFSYVLSVFVYYQRILMAGNLDDGHADETFVIALTRAGEFTAYHLALLAVASGYCIYNTSLIVDAKFQTGIGMMIYTLYFYLFVLEDSYVEVPVAVIVSAAYAAMLSLFWACHFKRLLLIRYEFYSRRDSDEHVYAKSQIHWKEVLVGVAFAEIICFLAYILVFEFFRADNYPVPAITGVLATECFQFVLIIPLVFLFNMRDLSRYYPTPAPPPIIHVVKTPDDSYRVSMKESGTSDAVSINEQTSEIHLVRLPSAQSNLNVDNNSNPSI